MGNYYKLKTLKTTTAVAFGPLSVTPLLIQSNAMIIADNSGVFIGDSTATTGTGFPVPTTTPILLGDLVHAGFTQELDASKIYVGGAVSAVRVLYAKSED